VGSPHSPYTSIRVFPPPHMECHIPCSRFSLHRPTGFLADANLCSKYACVSFPLLFCDNSKPPVVLACGFPTSRPTRIAADLQLFPLLSVWFFPPFSPRCRQSSHYSFVNVSVFHGVLKLFPFQTVRSPFLCSFLHHPLLPGGLNLSLQTTFFVTPSCFDSRFSSETSSSYSTVS